VDMKKAKRRSDCPINFALEIFGDKWTLLIIRDLMFKGKAYYSDFLKSEEKIATNILANRLGALEANGLVSKITDPILKNKIIYSLTRKGSDLAPMLVEIILWSAKYDPKTAAPKKFVAQAGENKKELLSNIAKNIRHKI
jgi:DNA-binding HxlR family transcriptional regulator